MRPIAIVPNQRETRDAFFLPWRHTACSAQPGVTRSASPYRFAIVVAGVTLAAAAIACVQGQRATDTADPGLPFGPAAVPIQPLSYTHDIEPIFDRDCLSCHSSREARGNYSVSSYRETMDGQTPGDARSSVVVDCSPGGSMYRYFSGDAVTKATMVFRWMVVYNGVENP
jgi:hypothetical protein